MGDVTYTELHKAVSGYDRVTRALHYLSADGLRFSFAENKSVNAFALLRSVIFGDKLPCFFNPYNGANQDELRIFYKNFGWTLFGENGLRGVALGQTLDLCESALRQAKSSLVDTTRSQECFGKRDLEAELSKAKNAAIEYAEEVVHGEKADANQLEQIRAKTLANLGAIPYIRKEQSDYDWNTKQYAKTVFFFPSINAYFSHPIKSPNYTARIEGGKLLVSSGIEVSFSVQTALAWLKGELPSVASGYGSLEKLEVCRPDGSPWIAIRAGCHYIDVAKDLGGEFAELLKPRHVVTLTQGQSGATYDPTPGADNAKFWARAESSQIEYNKAQEARTRQSRLNLLADVAKARDLITNQEQTLKGFQLRVEDGQSLIELREKELASVKAISIGATKDQLNAGALALVNSLKSLTA